VTGVRKSLGVASLSLVAAAVPGGCGGGNDVGENGQKPGSTAQGGETRREPTESGADAKGYRAFVAIEDENLVAVLEGPPWRLTRTVGVPTGPHNVAADPAGRHVAVSSPPAGQVTIFDSGGRVRAHASAGAGAHDVAFTPSGDALWVSAEDAGRIVKLDVPSGDPVGSG
jgi:DNA-binding beta-propeller fold protein YncE